MTAIRTRAMLTACVALVAFPACAKPVAPFSITVTDAASQRFTARQYNAANGCTGANASPTLSWSNAPIDAKSFAVTMFDPDANGGKGFWHWLATGVPATAKGLESGASGSPAMAALGVEEAANDFGQKGYGGPCPPVGQDHHYVITIYALNVNTLDLPDAATPADVAAAIKSHAIGQAQTTLMATR